MKSPLHNQFFLFSISSEDYVPSHFHQMLNNFKYYFSRGMPPYILPQHRQQPGVSTAKSNRDIFIWDIEKLSVLDRYTTCFTWSLLKL